MYCYKVQACTWFPCLVQTVTSLYKSDQDLLVLVQDSTNNYRSFWSGTRRYKTVQGGTRFLVKVQDSTRLNKLVPDFLYRYKTEYDCTSWYQILVVLNYLKPPLLPKWPAAYPRVFLRSPATKSFKISSLKHAVSDRLWLSGEAAMAGRENQGDLWDLTLGLDLQLPFVCAGLRHCPSPLCKIWGAETHV